MSNELDKKSQTIFEQIKRIDENGNEYWTAREFSKVLEYTDYRNFKFVVNKAIEACKNSGHQPDNHIVEFNDMIEVGKGAKRPAKNLKLERKVKPSDKNISKNHNKLSE
jgi:DNA-damage-inducible protein D